jgi:2-polyprenyl-3-methyl-5-hydroxy-6-metoxy-1,4-benzoquinol methylase
LCSAPAARQSVVAAEVYGDTAGRAVFSCATCDVRYLHPGLSPAEEAAFYAAEFESFMARRSGNAAWDGPDRHIHANEDQRRRRMTHLAPLLKPRSRILEIGCSSGFMLYPLAADGHACTGIEPSGVFSDYVRSRGLPCHKSIDELGSAERFDLILHYYVMEHLADPVAFVRRQLTLLNPGGRIVFEVPNANDALTTIYQVTAYARFIWVVSHRWYFTEASLTRVRDAAGAAGDVRLDQRYDLSNHLVWLRDGKPGGMGRFTSVLGQAIEDEYRQALIRNRHCDTLIGIFHA